MSAVCWLYGRMIHEALGGRPIGLIATVWGGTSIELWMPPKALEDCNTIFHRMFKLLFNFFLIYFLFVLYRSEEVSNRTI